MALLMVFVAATVAFQLVLSLRVFPHDRQLDGAAHDLTMIGITMLGFAFIGMYVAETKRRLHEETRLDSLTGLHNRRAFEEMIQREVQLAARDNTPLTLLMMDLDHFKQLNDTWGHALGDRALRTFGGVLLTVTGTHDAVARLGGEEFAILLPGRSARNAVSLAERLRATVEGLRLSEGEELVRFTVSIGLQLVAARRGRLRADAASRGPCALQGEALRPQPSVAGGYRDLQRSVDPAGARGARPAAGGGRLRTPACESSSASGRSFV